MNFPSTTGQPTDGSFTTVINGVKYAWYGYWTTTIGDIQAESINGGPLAGFRNLLINGDVSIHQRNTGVINTPDFGADRWYGYSTECQINRSRITDLPGFAWAIRVRNTAGGTTGKSITQGIELTDSLNAASAPFSQGEVYTLSWWARLQAGGTLDANDFAGNCNFRDSLNDTSNPSAAFTQSSVVQIDAEGDWRRFSRQVTIDQPAKAGNTCMTVRVSCQTGTENTDGIFITGLQLEPGPVATHFEQRPIGTELSLCQRYLYDVSSQPSATKFTRYSGVWRNTTKARIIVDYPVVMRTPPSLYTSGVLEALYGNSFEELTQLVLQAADEKSAALDATVASGPSSAGGAAALRFDNAAAAVIRFDAEF